MLGQCCLYFWFFWNWIVMYWSISLKIKEKAKANIFCKPSEIIRVTQKEMSDSKQRMSTNRSVKVNASKMISYQKKKKLPTHPSSLDFEVSKSVWQGVCNYDKKSVMLQNYLWSAHVIMRFASVWLNDVNSLSLQSQFIHSE